MALLSVNGPFANCCRSNESSSFCFSNHRDGDDSSASDSEIVPLRYSRQLTIDELNEFTSHADDDTTHPPTVQTTMFHRWLIGVARTNKGEPGEYLVRNRFSVIERLRYRA